MRKFFRWLFPPEPDWFRYYWDLYGKLTTEELYSLAHLVNENVDYRVIEKEAKKIIQNRQRGFTTTKDY